MITPSQLQRSPMATVVAALLPIALAATLAEAFALRLVLRMGQALPDRPGLADFFGAVASSGVYAQNLAMLAGTFTLLALALDRMVMASLRQRAAGALLLAATAGAALLAAGSNDSLTWTAAHTLSLAAMAAAVITAGAVPLRGGRAWLVLPLAVFAALVYHNSAAVAGTAGTPLPLAAEAYFIAEGLAVVAALLLPLAAGVRLPLRWWAVVAALPLVILLGLVARPWTVASLSVWTFGFTLYLPPVVYPLALAAYLATLIALVRRGGAGRGLAAGLAFLALAGLKLDYSYFHLLALLAVAYLTAPAPPLTLAVSPAEGQGAEGAASPLAQAQLF